MKHNKTDKDLKSFTRRIIIAVLLVIIIASAHQPGKGMDGCRRAAPAGGEPG